MCIEMYIVLHYVTSKIPYKNYDLKNMSFILLYNNYIYIYYVRNK